MPTDEPFEPPGAKTTWWRSIASGMPCAMHAVVQVAPPSRLSTRRLLFAAHRCIGASTSMKPVGKPLAARVQAGEGEAVAGASDVFGRAVVGDDGADDGV